MKRFPRLFSPCCSCYAEIGPGYFFRGVSLETRMESAFVDDFVVFYPILGASPLYFAPVISFSRNRGRQSKASSGFSGEILVRCQFQGRKLVDALGGMIGQAREDVGEPGLRIERWMVDG